MYRGIVMENGTPNEADDDGHGTHVCGSIAGFSGTSGSADSNGEHNGVAKDARLAFTDLAGADGDLVNTANMGSDYYQHAYDAGARIHSDSWGYSSKSYSSETYEVDEFAAANPLFLPMFAVGNAGDDTTTGVDTYGAPANAKNILAIGATLSSNSAQPTYLTGDTRAWNVEIGGPDAKHWAHGNIRAMSSQADVSNPSTHAISAQSVVYAQPANGCDAFTNAAAVAGQMVLISRGACTFATKVGPGQKRTLVLLISKKNLAHLNTCRPVSKPPPNCGHA
mmetsp:Transcript_11197/g.17986  ORF Transcript_11197/g.17986 Transcript_11197/m.17986 type:complete len:280 (-) Transcript_11197:100-939(-)